MPPARRASPSYGWLCVLQSTAEILSHAARIRAEQAARTSTCLRARQRSKPSTRIDKLNDVKSPSDGRYQPTETAPRQDTENPVAAATLGSLLVEDVIVGPPVSNEDSRLHTKLLRTGSPSTNEVETVSAQKCFGISVLKSTNPAESPVPRKHGRVASRPEVRPVRSRSTKDSPSLSCALFSHWPIVSLWWLGSRSGIRCGSRSSKTHRG